jgi:hypothetical protein
MSRRLLVLVVTALVLLPQAAASAVPIEGFAHYQPQTRCSPHPKPGTLKLAAWLQKTYPGTGSLGISRACKDGGTSEHKEGRAFDWAVSVHSARDRGYVANFFHRIFATDADGHRDALARRMGIMYVIWNDHIYSADRHFRKRSYLNSGCKSRKRCSQTLRHRNHVHISLTRAGGMGRTSWYTGKAPKPAPTPKPSPTPRPAPAPAPRQHQSGVLDLRKTPYVRLTLPTDGSVTRTRFKLAAGHRYRITAAGLFSYGAPQAVADASCVWSWRDAAWRPAPEDWVAHYRGALDLRVNGRAPFGDRCAASHVYRTTYKPKRTQTIALNVATHGATSGRLVFIVSRPGAGVAAALPTYRSLHAAPTRSASLSRGHGLLSETVQVPGTGPASTDAEVQAGATYRLTVSGSVSLGGGAVTDGACVQLAGSWYPHASLDLRYPGQDHGRLYVDGAPLASDSSCSSRQHVVTWTAARTGRLPLELWDPLDRSDDAGALTVRVQRLTPIPTPAAAPQEAPPTSWRRPPAQWVQAGDSVTVQSGQTAPAISTMRLRQGERAQITVSGVQHSGAVTADASCVLTAGGWVTRDPDLALQQDPLDLWVDGRAVTWQATEGNPGCSASHTYTTTVRAAKNGPLGFAVLDLDHSDNTDGFKVTLSRRAWR